MKITALIILLGLAIGVAYAVAFSHCYPLAGKTSTLSLFFALCGLLTSTMIVGLWIFWNGRKAAPQPSPATVKRMPPDKQNRAQHARKKRKQ